MEGHSPSLMLVLETPVKSVSDSVHTALTLTGIWPNQYACGSSLSETSSMLSRWGSHKWVELNFFLGCFQIKQVIKLHDSVACIMSFNGVLECHCHLTADGARVPPDSKVSCGSVLGRTLWQESPYTIMSPKYRVVAG